MAFKEIIFPPKYLGMPLTDNHLSKEVWESFTNKLKDKVNNWTNISLNLAGKLILTKVVLQTIPIFMFSALPVPIGVLQQIRNIQRRVKGKRKRNGL